VFQTGGDKGSNKIIDGELKIKPESIRNNSFISFGRRIRPTQHKLTIFLGEGEFARTN
jgi:hypothetical protein